MNQPIAFLLLVFALASCSSEQRQVSTEQYFDLQTFVAGQIDELNALHPNVEKTVVSGKEQETRQLATINWTKELDLFVQADLNKPAYRNSYQVEKPTEYSIVYRARPGEEVPVKYLKIELDPAQKKPRSVEATVTSENYLYNSEKRLLMHCSPDGKGNWLVRDYQVSGYQQLAFFDKKPFEVKGKVL